MEATTAATTDKFGVSMGENSRVTFRFKLCAQTLSSFPVRASSSPNVMSVMPNISKSGWVDAYHRAVWSTIAMLRNRTSPTPHMSAMLRNIDSIALTGKSTAHMSAISAPIEVPAKPLNRWFARRKPIVPTKLTPLMPPPEKMRYCFGMFFYCFAIGFYSRGGLSHVTAASKSLNTAIGFTGLYMANINLSRASQESVGL